MFKTIDHHVHNTELHTHFGVTIFTIHLCNFTPCMLFCEQTAIEKVGKRGTIFTKLNQICA